MLMFINERPFSPSAIVSVSHEKLLFGIFFKLPLLMFEKLKKVYVKEFNFI